MSRRALLTSVNELIRDPIVVLAAPRSGSSMFFAVLSTHPELWSLYHESKRIFEGPFHPRLRGWDSSALTAADLDRVTAEQLTKAFFDEASNLERLPLGRYAPIRGRGKRKFTTVIELLTRPYKDPPIRLVEKTVANTLRVGFIRALFPDARFVHLVRDPRRNIASIYRGWMESDRHNDYPLPPNFRILGFPGSHWAFLLQPGWRSLDGRRLIEICADQWRVCNEATMHDLKDVDASRALVVRYEDLVMHPAPTLRHVAEWAMIDPAPFDRFASGLPRIQTRSKPDDRKWEDLRDELSAVLPGVESVAVRLGYQRADG